MIITILILLYSYLASKLFFVGIFVIFVLLKFNKKKILPLLLILLLVSHPCFHHYPDVNEAYIIDIKPGYAIGICQFQKVIIYHDTDLNYDSVISFSNDYDLIPSNSHFFSFDSGSNYHRQNIHYQINAKNIVVKKQYFSLRSLLYKYSNSYIKKFVFNINDDNNILDGFVNSGVSFIGFIYLVRVILKPYIKDEIYLKIELFIIIFFALFYHFNYVTFRLLFSRLIKLRVKDEKVSLSFLIIASLILYPGVNYSLKFLIPVGLGLIRIFKYDKSYNYLYLLFLQGALFNSINILMLFCYRYFVYILGLCFVLSFFSLFFNLDGIYIFLNEIFVMINSFKLYGNPIGLLSILITIILYHRPKLLIGIYLILLLSKSLHPFASVNYINVNQGDAILIKDIFNQHVYLIDTGKKSSYIYLKNYLHALQIDKIDILFITHYDEDHCGNIDDLKKDFSIDRIIDYHFNTLIDHYSFYDLNNIISLDKNQSSLVILTNINDQDHLLMGDADVYVEKQIISEYDDLDIDYLKLGHHGSITSSSIEFLNVTKPKLSIISSGINSYNHPSPIIIKRLNNNKLAYLNTKEDGDIMIINNLFFDIILTSNKKIGIIPKR